VGSLPERIGPYRLERELARGGQGVVYRARGPEGAVALKVLLGGDDRARRRFRQEAAILLRLKHPNLLRGLDAGEVDDWPYLVTELIEGQDLKQWVKRGGPPSPELTRSLLREVADALAYCHDSGLVHRDLKPANVILEGETRRPVVIDFGLALRDPEAFGALSIDDLSRLSLSGEIKGTPAYMAPEQADPSFGDVGPHTDVYALGALLYFLLTGQAPYRGASAYNVLNRLLRSQEAPPDPLDLVPHSPPDLVELCRACLAKRPAGRPASAGEFGRRLAPPPPVTGQRPPLGAVLVTAGLLAGGVGGSLWVTASSLPSPEPRSVASSPPAVTPRPVTPAPRQSAATPTAVWLETLERIGAMTLAGEHEAALEELEAVIETEPGRRPRTC
jgi:serine/threonine-protein kinase